MAAVFRVVEHTIAAQNIRHYRGGSIDDRLPTKLCIKQYIPLDNQTPKPGDVTVLAAHANGLVKEVYEPLFESLHAASKSAAWRLRAIWIADSAHQGTSAVANRDNLGDDLSFFDLSRDLLHMANEFRDEIQAPIFGLGHSMGATSLAFLSFMHPRLFSCLVFIEPSILPHGTTFSDAMMKFAAAKKDTWPSRSEAEQAIIHSRFYATWDPRALDRYLRFGIREETDAALLPAAAAQTFTLTTPKHQEVFSLGRPNFANKTGADLSAEDRDSLADLDPDNERKFPFFRPETTYIGKLLPMLRPPILFLYGTTSRFATKEQQRDNVKRTGTGPGGSGGVDVGQVEHVTVEGGHLLPVENPDGAAEQVAKFYERQMQALIARERRWMQKQAGKTVQQRQMMDDEFLARVMSINKKKMPKL